MFFKGKIYRICKPSTEMQAALQWAVATHIRDMCAATDPLEAMDEALRALDSLPVVQFLARHLIPDLPEIGPEDAAEVVRWLKLAHSNPTREEILTIRDSRRYANGGLDG